MAINTGYEGNNTGAVHHASKAFEEAKAFTDAVSSTATNFSQAVDLRGRVQRNPVAMVCVAAGIGYVLGGGLFSPTTARLLKIGVRLALIPFVKSQLSNMAGQVVSSATQAGEGSPGSTF